MLLPSNLGMSHICHHLVTFSWGSERRRKWGGGAIRSDQYRAPKAINILKYHLYDNLEPFGVKYERTWLFFWVFFCFIQFVYWSDIQFWSVQIFTYLSALNRLKTKHRLILTHFLAIIYPILKKRSNHAVNGFVVLVYVH